MARTNKRGGSRFGTVLILLGLVLLLGGSGLVGYNIWDSRRAEKSAREVADKLESVIGVAVPEETATVSPVISAPPETEAEEEPTLEEMIQDLLGEDQEETEPREMKTVTVDGYAYIGLITIPSLDLSVPVMDQWDYERLKTAACLYSGSYYTDDMVVCAHNYITLFDSIRRIRIGADVYFTNVDGETIHYIVTNVESLAATAIEDMVENSYNSTAAGTWELTLFTCNTGGQTRCAVRCEIVS